MGWGGGVRCGGRGGGGVGWARGGEVWGVGGEGTGGRGGGGVVWGVGWGVG